MKYLLIGLVVVGCGLAIVTEQSVHHWTPPTNEVVVNEPPPPPPSWTLTFTGDIMLDRNVRTAMISRGGLAPLLAPVKSELTGDLVIGNLEGPFTNSTNHALPGGSLSFTFEPKYAPQLKAAGFTVVSLANNHTLNHGQSGLDLTRSTLDDAKIDYFGDPANRSGFTLIKEVQGTRIGLVGYHGLVDGIDNIIADITAIRSKADLIIVMPHEGIEYNLKYSTKQQQDYHRLIDAGADMIIGAHPHVVEPIEIYKGKLIAYSLGNFLFDQYFSTDTQQELLLHINGQGKNFTSVDFVPLESSRSIISPANNTVTTALLKRIASTSITSEEIKSQLRSGSITFTQ